MADFCNFLKTVLWRGMQGLGFYTLDASTADYMIKFLNVYLLFIVYKQLSLEKTPKLNCSLLFLTHN